MKKYNETILKEIENIKEIFEEPIKIINEGTKEYELIKAHIDVYYYDLDYCYNSYSRQKERVYNNYLNIYSKLFEAGFIGRGFGINSYSKMQFTICMRLYKNDVMYKIYITKCYNKIIAY